MILDDVQLGVSGDLSVSGSNQNLSALTDDKERGYVPKEMYRWVETEERVCSECVPYRETYIIPYGMRLWVNINGDEKGKINWNDGGEPEPFDGLKFDGTIVHNYKTEGTYTIEIYYE